MEIRALDAIGSEPNAGAASAPVNTEENREIIQAVKALNGVELFGHDSELTFSMDRATQRTVVRLVDRNTKEVIRQIPPEFVLRVAEELRAQLRQNSPPSL